MKYLHYYENIEGLTKYLVINYIINPEILYIIEPTNVASNDSYPDKLIQYNILYRYSNNELEKKSGNSKTYLNLIKKATHFQSDNLEECKMFLAVKKYNI